MLRHSKYALLLLVIAVGCDQKPGTRAGNSSTSAAGSQTAVCNLEAVGESGVTGTIRFTQRGDTMEIRGSITGLTPGKHGFHVHENGDLSDKVTGKSAGGHFNPTNEEHGRPSDSMRHVGDLGNIEADENGTAEVQIDDNVVRLDGPNSITGRSLVVHAQADQFTQPSGDAGDRVAFGVIEAETK